MYINKYNKKKKPINQQRNSSSTVVKLNDNTVINFVLKAIINHRIEKNLNKTQ